MQIAPSVVESGDAAATASTTLALSVGESAQGTISGLGDHDWYRVTLQPLETYTIAAIGTGTQSLRDTFLLLFDEAGNKLAGDDDSGPQYGSNLTYTVPASGGGTYYVDVGAYGDESTGQYGLSLTAGTRASFDVAMGGGAVDGYASWSAVGTPATITYGFRQSAPSYTATGHDLSSFSQFTTAQMAATVAVMQLVSDVCNVTFQQVNPGGYTNSATILLANYSDGGDGSGAFAFYPGSTASSSAAGDVWLNLGGGVSASSTQVGTWSWAVLVHELGHALGLSHPGDYNAAPGQSITYANNAQFTQDSEQYSVMSYFDGANTGQSSGIPETPMLFDIYELQRIYGANMSTRTGDTVYGFGSTAGALYDFASNTSAYFCVWDAGGNDTLDGSGYAQNQLIDLNEAGFSNIGGLVANISIALGVTIETAIGGAGNDTLLGNAADNFLRGGAGTDSLQGGAGIDHLQGGAGADSLDGGSSVDFADYTAAGGGVLANLLTPGDNSGEAAGDSFVSIEGLIGSAFADVLRIGNGGSSIYANGGNDFLFGGDGLDDLHGGAGIDHLLGGAGADLLDGGDGVDFANYSSAGGGVLANLQTPADNSGDAAGDSFLSVEGLIGSAFADVLVIGNGGSSIYGNEGDDFLIGGNGADDLHGGAGIDHLLGGAGADLLDGGAGVDFADYLWAAGGVLANLLTPQDNSGEAAGDSFLSVEGLIGSRFDDVLRIADGGGTVYGNEGNDFLFGGGGADLLFGGIGNDTFVFVRGQGTGDTIADFGGSGPGPGDGLLFTGYGTAAEGASFTQVDASRWSINSSDGTVHDIVTFGSSPAIHISDWLFV